MVWGPGRLRHLEATSQALQEALLASLEKEANPAPKPGKKSKQKRSKRSDLGGATKAKAQPAVLPKSSEESPPASPTELEQAADVAILPMTPSSLGGGEAPSGVSTESGVKAQGAGHVCTPDSEETKMRPESPAQDGSSWTVVKKAICKPVEDDTNWTVVKKPSRKTRSTQGVLPPTPPTTDSKPSDSRAAAVKPRSSPAITRCPSMTSLTDSTCSAESSATDISIRAPTRAGLAGFVPSALGAALPLMRSCPESREPSPGRTSGSAPQADTWAARVVVGTAAQSGGLPCRPFSVHDHSACEQGCSC